MAAKLLVCRVCGGKFNVLEDNKTIECRYCGQVVNIPTLDDRLVNQYNRGTYLRQKHEFENAARVYQRIIAEYPDEWEAYWGLLLSRYGIEYVDDKGIKVPTLHRMQFHSILKDPDYCKIIESVDDENKRVYQENASVIASIQERYFAIINNETPYDVFICYKDTEIDAPHRPTMDRAYAQEIYDALTKQGYKVFFSHVSL